MLPPCTQGPRSTVSPGGESYDTAAPSPARWPLVPEAGSSENTDEWEGISSTDSGSGRLALLRGTVCQSCSVTSHSAAASACTLPLVTDQSVIS